MISGIATGRRKSYAHWGFDGWHTYAFARACRLVVFLALEIA
jgi:hypothetical protein